MRIHFVCTGNVYRSRLAEAWCASRRVPGIEVSSSGIAAGRESPDPISPWAAAALAGMGVERFAANHWQKTTRSLVEASEVLVFMESEHRLFCRDWIEPGRQRIEVWAIEDIGPIPAEQIPDKVERTFALIRERTDALLESLRAGAEKAPE
ncbi:MAG TPA: hypothetical protein VHX13_09050 [Acidobacteriaceae bacterium]|jgi:protein-tyrosine-phosphatase|nr:hypothetical protein [Acidobacteriaceae bacterium]